MKTISIGILIVAFCFLYGTYVENNIVVCLVLISGFAIFIFGALRLLEKLISNDEHD